MTLSCRAQAFSVDNLLKTEKSTSANSSSPESHPFTLQRQFPKLHAHSWTNSSKPLTNPEFLITNNDNNATHVLNSDAFENSRNTLLLHHDLLCREEIPLTGQFKRRRYQDELAQCCQIYKFSRHVIDSENGGVSEKNTVHIHPSRVDGIDAEQKDSRMGSRYESSESSREPSSCFCHREMNFCNHPAVMSVADTGRSDSTIVVELCHSDLWASFHRIGTEMIITKSGRRMFPALKLRINNLNPDKYYIVRLEFVQPDTRKYRYIYHSSRWMVSGSGDKLTTPQLHVSPERPASGQAICSQVVSFERLKLTNAEASRTGQVSLISMQKFQPQVVIQEVYNTDCSGVEHSEQYVITFPQTSFMAVTAYQNQQVTTLKIASNPFAKGFRESGKARIPFESFVTGLPNLLTCNSSASYLPGLMKPSTWTCCFQRDLNSNCVNESCDALSSVSTCEDLRVKLFKMEGKDWRTSCLNFDVKGVGSSVHETLYKSQETITDHHLLPHELHPLHIQQRQEEDLKQQQRLLTSQFNLQPLFHPLPVDVKLLRHIPVPTSNTLTHGDPSRLISTQEKVLALPRSEHMKSEYPFSQLSDVHIVPTNKYTKC